jgi:hypothetical protein
MAAIAGTKIAERRDADEFVMIFPAAFDRV